MQEIKNENNVNGVTIFNLCKMAAKCTKFREIISKGIKVKERTRFRY